MSSSLERAALAGTLTSNQTNQTTTTHPNLLQPNHHPISNSFQTHSFHQLKPITNSFQDDSSQFDNQSNPQSYQTPSMSRGWSGNTGPKGVLLDFKASHGKSGAILGGHHLNSSSSTTNNLNLNSINHPISLYPSQPSISSVRLNRNPNFNHHRDKSTSSPIDSDSDSSERDSAHLQSKSNIISSSKTSTRFTFSNSTSSTQTSHHRPFLPKSLSPIPQSTLNSHIKFDSRGKKLFGHLREVGVENFIQAIESEKEDHETIVLVHLYDPAIESCLILNHHLSNLARIHPRTKFLRALASELDFFNQSPNSKSKRMIGIPTLESKEQMECLRNLNLMDDDPFEDEANGIEVAEEEEEEDRTGRATDSDILPTLIWYRSGEYVQSLPALEREMPAGGIVRGEDGLKDLERLLKRNGIINEPGSMML